MKLTIKVSYRTPAADVVTDEVTTSIATIAAWERKFKRRISDLQAGIGVDDLMYLAWHRINQLKKDPRDYDTWLESVESFDVLEVAQTNPTDQIPSDAS